MAIVTTDDKHYRDIAEAIRTKFGTTDRYKPEEMAPAVMNLDSYEEYLGEITGFGTLENTSWEYIKMAAQGGDAANIWAVGDTKSVVVNGTFGGITLSNVTYYVYILGFNHNEEYEGKGIHFGCFKTAGNVDIMLMSVPANTTNTNAGGWASSNLRTVASEFLFCLPAELQAVIAECPKYTDNVGGTSNAASNVTATRDKIFIPAEYEVFGANSSANTTEPNYQKQYDYFAAGNSTVRYMHTSVSTPEAWRLRSPYRGDTYGFAAVFTAGYAARANASLSYGITPYFKVG